MSNHDHALLAIFGLPSILFYLVYCQREHVARKRDRWRNR